MNLAKQLTTTSILILLGINTVFSFNTSVQQDSIPVSSIQSFLGDTVFLKTGDQILILPNYKLGKRVLSYSYAVPDTSNDRYRIKTNQIHRIGKNKYWEDVNIKKTKKYIIRTQLLDDRATSGQLINLDTSFVSILVKNKNTMNISVPVIKKIKIINRNKRRLSTFICGFAGLILGPIILPDEIVEPNDGGEAIGKVITNSFIGFTLGAVTGHLIGSIGINLPFNGNQNTYRNQIRQKSSKLKLN